MRPIIFNPTSPHEQLISRAVGARLWDHLMKFKASNHSSQAGTLPYLVRRAERAGIPYHITAHPGVGYVMQRIVGVTRPE